MLLTDPKLGSTLRRLHEPGLNSKPTSRFCNAEELR